MAIFDRTTFGGLVPSIGEGVRLVGAAVRAIAMTTGNRRAARKLIEMPDYLLADIGLKRDDVHDALNLDWRCDPTSMLAMRAADRACRGKIQ